MLLHIGVLTDNLLLTNIAGSANFVNGVINQSTNCRELSSMQLMFISNLWMITVNQFIVIVHFFYRSEIQCYLYSQFSYTFINITLKTNIVKHINLAAIKFCDL